MSSIPVDRQFWRLGLSLTGFAALFALVGYRLHYLQVENTQRLAGMAEKQTARTWILPATRGGIYDQSGAPLVESNATWLVTADPLYMDDKLRAVVMLPALLHQTPDELRAHFESGKNGRTIARGLDDPTAEKIRALKLGGVYLHRDFTRIYREGALAAHIVGYTQHDGGGGAGIEQQFESVLAGKSGHETLRIDALGKPILTDGESIAPQNGAQVQLTIDVTMQRILEKEVMAAVDKHAPKNAMGVMVRPTTGEIVAMCSWPTFDPADRSQFTPERLRNNALSFVYEPGSTMKPLVAGAAVADKLASFTEVIDCEHGAWTYRTGKAARTIHEKSGGHGPLTVVQGIALSDNILMAKLGIRLGPDRLHEWIRVFNFGRRTGVCLPGEDGGIMLPQKQWSVLGSCMSVPIGHEVAVTPMQLAMAHAAVANGGLWQPPRLVKRVFTQDQDGGVRDLPPPTLSAPRRVFQAEDAAEIQDAMTHTMTEGTGKGCALVGYTSAGKTGTAEKLIGGRYSNEHNVGSFVCWSPAERGVPAQLLCLVVIDDPSKNGRFGAETAAPVVQRVLQQSLEYLGVPKRADLLPDDGAEHEVETVVAKGDRPRTNARSRR